MKNWGRKHIMLVLLVFLSAAVLVIGILAVLVGLNPPQESQVAPKGLPEIKIGLNDATLDEIKENDKETKYFGNTLTLANGDDILEFNDVEIKGRGNATWLQPKKPYQFKLPYKADLLGLGKRKKWILLANYMDTTDLRTDAAFYLERMIGEKFAYRGEFVELYVNEDYEGLYYLTRGIEIGKNAVDLKDPLGVLVELDNIYGKNEQQYFVTGNGECLTVKDAVAEENVNIAMEDFMTSFNELELAIQRKDYAAIESLIDVRSFAQYYILSEFMVNYDAYFTSQYFYKDGPEDKIYAGPAWDFDIALNNYEVRGEFLPTDEFTGTIGIDEYNNRDSQYLQWSRLFARLIKIPEFRVEVEKVFMEQLSGRKRELLWHIFKQAARIHPAVVRDNVRWEKGFYVKDVKRLLQWVNDRYDYFEVEYGKKEHKNYPTYDINVIEV